MLSALSCGREPTAPRGTERSVRSSQGISWITQFPKGFASYQATGALAITQVRVTLKNPDGSVALDTLVTFPPGVDEITANLTVTLPSSAPAGGVPLAMNLAYQNSSGQTIWTAGPQTVTAVPATPGAPAPPPTPVVVAPTYTGPGASTAVAVIISPKSQTVNTGGSFQFAASARDANGNAVNGIPIAFTVTSGAGTTINVNTGAGTAGPARGTSTIAAMLPTGATDQAVLTVISPPASIALVSGNAQSANVNATLQQPVVVKVTATDGGPSSGVTVNFAAGSGGTATPASATTDANGLAQATWKLGATAGAQSLTITSTGLTGSPINVNATAIALPPARLAIGTQPPTTVQAGTAFGLVVNVIDATGAITSGFTGPVTIALGGTPPAGAALNGTTTVNAVAGVATFAGLTLGVPGSYTIAASSSGLVAATSNVLTVTAGNAAKLVFQAYPVAGAVAGSNFGPVTVEARDAFNNLVSTFTGAVSIAPSSGIFQSGSTTTVNAVAGVATFPTTSITVAGSYTLTATASGMTSAVGPSFAITPGPASSLILGSGGGQSAAGAATLPSPVVVRTTDAFGNGIPGKTVTFTPAAGSGSVTPTSGVSDASGNVQTTWTIGSTAGTMTLNATSAGLTPSPLVINATATSTTGPGPATHLAWTTAPLGGTAGAAFSSLVVTAKDAGNATATSFTGNVTLAITANPGGGTLSGTVTVAAVAGVATFTGLSINKAGTGYTLTASSGTLTTATTLGFNITAAAAANIVADSGSGQAGTVSTAIANPFVARVTDAFGNAVSGTTVTWAVTAGGGSVSATSTTTDANGRARTTLTMGSVAGLNTVTASSTGLTGSPVTFSASSAAGVATKLVFTTQPANVTAGVPFTTSPVVQAQDAFGNPVTSFAGTDTITITTNPGTATLGGNPIVVASGGNATFSNLRFNKIGTGYVITAKSGTLAAAVSSAFNVVAAPAVVIAVDSGQGQTALAGVALPVALVARVVDSLANPVSGVAVTWGTPNLGGSLAGQTTTTDVNGRVRATWTLGVTAGGDSVTLTSTGLAGSPITFTATGTSLVASKVWVGSTTAWSTASNWSPPGVPASGDSVLIQPSAIQPLLTANVTVKNLTVQPLATLDLGAFQLTVTGSVDAGTTIVGTGQVNLTGTGTLKGVIVPNVSITGTYTLAAGTDSVKGNVDVGTGGSLTVGAQTLRIGGNFSTSATGVLNMSAAGGAVVTYGSATFNGGASTLSNGTFQVYGNFAQSGAATTYAATGNHTTMIAGGASTVAFTDATAASRFNHVTFVQGSPVLATGFTANDLTLGVGVITFNSAVTLRIRDSIMDPNARYAIPNTKVFGSTFKFGNNPATNVQFVGGGTTTMGSGLVTTGNVTVDSNTTVALNGHVMSVSGNFATANGGILRMVSATDSLIMNGNVTFGGGAESGNLSAGAILLNGTLTTGPVGGYSASGTQVMQFTGASNQSVTGQFNAQNVVFGGTGGVTFANASTNSNINGAIYIRSASGNVTGHVQLYLNGTTFNDSTPSKWLVDTLSTGGCGCAMTLPSSIKGLLRFGGNMSLGGSLTADSLEVYSGTVTFNGKSVVVNGALRTKGNGSLQLTNAADALTVSGNADFSGWQSDFSAGSTTFKGDFKQTNANNGRAFRAQAGHLTTFTGTAAQHVFFAGADATLPTLCGGSCFGNLTINKASGTVAFDSTSAVQGSLLVNAGVTSVVASDSIGGHKRAMVVKGGVTTAAGTGVHISNLMVRGAIAIDSFTVVDSITYAGVGPTQAMLNRYMQRVTIRGAPAVTMNLWNIGPALVVDSGKFDLAGFAATVDTLRTQSTGVLFAAAAGNATDSIKVNALLALGGGLSAPAYGRLYLYGNASIAGTAAAFTGAHETRVLGSAAQALDGTSPVAGQGLHHVRFENAGTKTLTGTLTFSGDVTVDSTGLMSAPVAGTGSVTIGGNFHDFTLPFAPLRATVRSTPAVATPAALYNAGGGWTVAATTFAGSGWIYASNVTSAVTVSGSRYLTHNVSVTGNVSVAGTGALLNLTDETGTPADSTDDVSHTLTITGNFGTAGGGVLKMKLHTDYLGVTGSVNFSGGDETALLTEGLIEVIGDFTQGGTSTSFVAAPHHIVSIGPLGALYPAYVQAPVATLRTPTISGRSYTFSRKDGIVATGKTPIAATPIDRRAQFIEARNAAMALDRRSTALHDRRDSVVAEFIARGANTLSARAARGESVTRTLTFANGVVMANTATPPSNITFANPTTSQFGYLYLAANQYVLHSDVNVAGTFGSGYASSFAVASDGTHRKVTSHGANVRYVTFHDVRWELLDGSAISSMLGVSFEAMDPTADQFTVNRAQSPAIDCITCYLQLTSWSFDTTLTTGRYINAIDNDGIAPALNVKLVGVFPIINGGKVGLSGGATLTGWASAFVWTGLGSDAYWTTGANWSTGVQPTSTDDVSIPAGTPQAPTFAAASTGNVHNLTIAAGVQITVPCGITLYVAGNLTAPGGNTSAITDCGDGDAVILNGDGSGTNTVRGTFDLIFVNGPYTVGVGNTLKVQKQLVVTGGTGNLVIGGGTVDVTNTETGYGGFYTTAAGVLTMTNSADSMAVGTGGAWFQGGGTTGKLTAGKLVLLGTLVDFSCLHALISTAAHDAFAASGTHKVVFGGLQPGKVEFYYPTESFMQDAEIAPGTGMILGSDVMVKGTLSRGSATVSATSLTTVLGATYTLTTSGLNFSSGAFTNINSVLVRLVDGTSNATFDSVIWAGTGFTSPLFTVARTSGSYTFTGHDFSMIGLGIGGYFLSVTAPATVTMSSANPLTGVLGTQYTTSGGGVVHWP